MSAAVIDFPSLHVVRDEAERAKLAELYAEAMRRTHDPDEAWMLIEIAASPAGARIESSRTE